MSDPLLDSAEKKIAAAQRILDSITEDEKLARKRSQNLARVMRWREAHPDQYREYQRRYTQSYRQRVGSKKGQQ